MFFISFFIFFNIKIEKLGNLYISATNLPGEQNTLLQRTLDKSKRERETHYYDILGGMIDFSKIN
jgi:hypothetical protein